MQVLGESYFGHNSVGDSGGEDIGVRYTPYATAVEVYIVVSDVFQRKKVVHYPNTHKWVGK